MKRTVGTLVGVFALFFFLAPLAHAINISLAQVQSGVAVVQGGKAAANATITLEGGNVAKASKNGGFSFSGVVPSDCVGTLSDGVTTMDVVLANCTPVSKGGGVLKTGQTNTNCSYLALPSAACGMVQDGDLQRGAARSYTDNGDGTITDNTTGLVWEKLGNLDGLVNLGDPHDADNTYTWADAFQKVADLNTANFTGHNDWRLPNVNELQTLQDYGRAYLDNTPPHPTIDPVFDNGVDSFTYPWIYWSSTTYTFLGTLAWAVFFNNHSRLHPGSKTGSSYVRAVRGGS